MLLFLKMYLMKQMIVLLSCLVFMIGGIVGCVKEDIRDYEESAQKQLEETRAISFIGDAVYHQTTDSWIVPRQDPYVLDNFQRAYDGLLSGKLAVNLSADMLNELSEIRLTATHYNIKIYPKTEAEQMQLETTDDVVISYIPFNYIQLPNEVTEQLDKHVVFAEASRYTETHDDFVSMEGTIEPFTVTLPVLYAVWPCDKQFPADMDYEILNEIFIPEDIPQTRSDNMTAMQLLEQTAIEQALGNGSSMTTRTDFVWAGGRAHGRIFNSDNVLNTYVPVPNVKVRYSLGSRTWETFTNDNGEFSIVSVPAEANLSFIFQTNKWKVTTENSTAAYTMSRGVHQPNHAEANFYGCVSFPVMEVHRAVNFYYNYSHAVPVYSYESGIRVIVLNTPYIENTNNVVGRFTYSTTSNAFITIANQSNCGHVVGTVLHEFGHWTHYGIKEGKFNAYNKIHNLICESWASYVGWYLGELYYKSLGWVKSSRGEDITLQARQGWNYLTSSWYSPLFVDLRDDYNQNGRDAIKEVSFTVINDILRSSTDWRTCRAAILSKLSGSYSTAVLNDFFVPYDKYIDPKTLSISPNPVTSNVVSITLGGEIAGDGTLRIYDAAARLVFSTTKSNLHPGLTFSITTSTLSSGVYTAVMSFTGNDSYPSGQASGTFIRA